MSRGRPFFVSLGGAPPEPVQVSWGGPSGSWRATVGDDQFTLRFLRRHDDGTLDIEVDGEVVRVRAEEGPDGQALLHFDDDGPPVPVRTSAADLLTLTAQRPRTVSPPSPAILSPIAGEVIEVLVEAGDPVHGGTPLLRMEAMKMELEIRSHAPGVVAAVHVRTGDRVRVQAPLVDLDLADVVVLHKR